MKEPTTEVEIPEWVKMVRDELNKDKDYLKQLKKKSKRINKKKCLPIKNGFFENGHLANK